MQTILKVVCDNRGQVSMVDDYLVRFRAKAANEEQAIILPPTDTDDVTFVRDDEGEISRQPRRTTERAVGRLRKFAKPRV